MFWGTLGLAVFGASVFWLLRDMLATTVIGDSAASGTVGWLALGVALTVAAGSQGALLNGLRRIGDSAEDLIELFRGFSYGTILRLDELPERLPPVDRLCARLDWLPSDGSDQGFFDVLVTRHAELLGAECS